jgi:ribokinase
MLTPMAGKIIVVGSSNTDMIVKADRIPRPGETVIGGAFSSASGGKGANQAVAATRAGGDVTFVARIGCDAMGNEALAGFIADGVDVEHVVRDSTLPSGVALILIGERGENSIAVASGANAALNAADVHAAHGAFDNATVVLTQLETPLDALRAARDEAIRCGAMFILNPAPARSLDDAILTEVSFITPNEGEAELLSGVAIRSDDDARRAAMALRDRGVETVLITLGRRGVYALGDDIDERLPAFLVEAIDSTAAGDVFNGALAVALAEGRPLREAIRFASAAAAISVTRLGAQPSAPRRDAIEDFLGTQTVR